MTTGAGRRRRSRDAGQATVELALALPLVAVLLLVIAQVGLVVRDQVLVVHAAREGARAASVQSSSGAAAAEAERAVRAAVPLERDRLRVDTSSSGGLVRVTVRYRAPVDLPLIGVFLQDVDLEATSVMAAERS